MISLFFPQSPLCTAAIVFYTYVCIPLGKLKKQCGDARPHDDDDDGYNLTSVMFGDKEKKKEKEEEICCSICLVDYEAEDEVTHLPRCNHLFHVHCIEPWLLRGSLTCPLCRAFVFTPTPTHNNVINVHSSSTFHLSLVSLFFLLFLHHLIEYLL